ncbi:MAG: malto-oligosyltrehalose synthase [Myxococcales bacterium]|nr:malto-oligosyltrehalose synthase [Myxococcales bacterium]
MRKIPKSTYRLQLQPEFTLDQAGELADYFEALGVSHAYLSPHLQAASGSTHGYDVVDHSRVNAELGGEAAHERMHAALSARGIGVVVDLVPNHMSIGTDANRWWWDILENGRASLYASYFDVDWHALEQKHENRVLLPILGKHYGTELEAGNIRLERRGGNFVVVVYDRTLPMAPLSLPEVLEAAAIACGSDELRFCAEAVARLPAPTTTDPAEVRARERDRRVLGQLLARLFREQPEVGAAVDRELSAIVSDFERLDALLERQNYRLSHWRAARHDLAYRRFFDVSELAALRVEDETVFAETHGLVLDWVRRGIADGLRVDHPDGLRDPEAYLRRLRESAPDAWLVIEKILEPGERLPETFPVDGTTGYDFMRFLTGLQLDPEGSRALAVVFERFSGEARGDFSEFVRENKRKALRELLGADLDRLAVVGRALCEQHRESRDFTTEEIRQALKEIAACMPVYRTYLRAGHPPRPADSELLHAALSRVRRERPEIDPELLDVLTPVLNGTRTGPRETDLALRFQQLTGPAMAKGAEDTAFFAWGHLLCTLEVGHDPGEPCVSLEQFHAECARRATELPHSMLSNSTHDTKRSADVRARLCLLSECATYWGDTLDAVWEKAERYVEEPLDRATLHYFFESWVGAAPVTAERLENHMLKAVREAKTHTAWTHPNLRYEQALAAFCRACFTDESVRREIEQLVGFLRPAWCSSALAQHLLLLTAPGVPDLYQGNELWDLSLTDPDNRRPVDFQLRRRLLQEVGSMSAETALARSNEGLPKFLVTARALALRKRAPEHFVGAAYEPVLASGPRADRVVAFMRSDRVLTLAPRLCLGVAERGWQDTTLSVPRGSWRDVLSGQSWHAGEHRVAELLGRFPVALLEREGA